MKSSTRFRKLKKRVASWAKPILEAASPAHRALSQSLPESLPPAPPVVVVGDITRANGLGEVARGGLRALRKAGHSAAYIDIASGRKIPDPEIPANAPFPKDRRINLVHNVDQTPNIYRKVGPGFFRGQINIGYWFWELTEFPNSWYRYFQPFTEIWVGSRFCQSVLASISPVPVVWVPPVLEPVSVAPCTRADMGLPEDRFIFYFSFDVLSVLQRKNPLGLIEAYRRAFGENCRETCLVIKMSGAQQAIAQGHMTGLSLVDFHQLATELNQVGGVLINRQLAREDTNALMAMCDCYVSLHRSEGFGMTIAEAMYYGKPTIATAYSGNLDFMTPANSFGVGYRLVELERDYLVYKAGTHWAEPDLDHAAECMQKAFADRARAKAMGEQAAQDIRREYSTARVAEIMLQRMQLAVFQNS
jgi:glycosyltransferase involved in cell wall biosynthesis